MKFSPTPLGGAMLLTPDPIEDERGFFLRAFTVEEFEKHGLNPAVANCSISYNRHKSTLRGMHFQVAPHAEAKLVRCIQGALFDVIVDLRPESPTFKQWFGAE